MTNFIRVPELLAPAGNMEKLATAILYGADAVYLGGAGLNLRAGASGFSGAELPLALDMARKAGVKAYYLLNVLPRQNLLDQVRERLDHLGELAAQGLGPDAVIAADTGVARMLRRSLPDMPLHVSTQANTANSQAVAFWRDFGARRVNVAREIRQEELAEMLAACQDPDSGAAGMELEIFVHGAQCMAVSGQCLLSAWLNDRPANLGQCSHPCRYGYRAAHLVLEEATRPGRAAWEARSDCVSNYESSDESSDKTTDDSLKNTKEALQAKGPLECFTTLLAPGDLCLIEHLDQLARMGVAAVKIEGRTKSSAYLAQVTDAYATALARVRAGHGQETEDLMEELVNAASRPLTTGFFRMEPGAPARQPVLAEPPESPRVVLCRVLEETAPGRWAVEAKHTWNVDRTPVEMMLPGCRRPGLPASEFRLEDEYGHTLAMAHPGMRAVLACDRPELVPGLFLRTGRS